MSARTKYMQGLSVMADKVARNYNLFYVGFILVGTSYSCHTYGILPDNFCDTFKAVFSTAWNKIRRPKPEYGCFIDWQTIDNAKEQEG